MSNFVTVKTNKGHRKNKGVIVGSREVRFDDFCMAEVPERYIEEILSSDPSISLVSEGDIEKYSSLKETLGGNGDPVPDIDIIDENGELKKDNFRLLEENKTLKDENMALNARILDLEKVEPGTGVSTEPDIEGAEGDTEALDDVIETATVAELKALCEESGFPRDEWKNKKSAELKAYVRERFESEQKE